MSNKIVWSIGILCLFVAMWYLANQFIEPLEIGPNPTFVFSNNFRLVRGDLLYIKDGNEGLDYRQSFPFQEPVNSFYANDDWLIGKTKKCYFAINLKTQEIHYPLDTEDKIAELSNINAGRERWTDTSGDNIDSKYLIRFPGVENFRKYFNISSGVIIAGLCLGLIIWIRKPPNILKPKI
jgi:hypothetical protein